MIVKHANPCGVAIGASAAEAYAKAWQTDPTSAYGGIVAFNRPFDGAAAEAIHANKQFVEVLIAPAITAEARALFASKAQRAPARGADLAATATRSTSSASAAACCCKAPTTATCSAPS